MKTGKKYRLILITVPNRKIGQKLARTILRRRLAACASLAPGLESHYWWKGKLETASEILLILKTEKVFVERLQKLVLREHPYEVPEFLALDIAHGSPPYLNWISESLK